MYDSPSMLLGRDENCDILEFGDLPHDNEELEPDYEFDAANDETFGAELGNVETADMEQYAEQTAHLDDDTGKPISSDQNQLWVRTMLESSVSNLLSDSDDNLPSCSEPLTSSSIHRLPSPNLPSPDEDKHARQRFANFLISGSHETEIKPFIFDIDSVNAIWRNSTLDELRNKKGTISSRNDNKSTSFLNENASYFSVDDKLYSLFSNATMQSVIDGPSIPQRSMMTVGDLEKSIIDEQQRQKTDNQPSPTMLTVEELEKTLQFQSVLDESPKHQLPQRQQCLAYPPFNVPPPPFWNPQVRTALMARISATRPFPSGFASFARPPMLNKRFSGGPFPPLSWSGPLRHPPPGLLRRRPPPPPGRCFPPPPNGHYLQQARRSGLPSGRTICDYAFDPYAGLMSRKEREWLVKIQELQMRGELHEDFYYAMWKERQLRADLHLSPPSTSPSSDTPCYVPPAFVGSLGRPTFPTVNYPRQLIDLHPVNSHESSSSPSSQTLTPPPMPVRKSFKTLLFEVEQGWALVLEVEEQCRLLPSFDETHRQPLLDCIDARMSQLFKLLLGPRLISVISLKKGRQLVARLLRRSNDDQAAILIADIAAQLKVFAKKDGAGEMQSALFPSLFESMPQLSPVQLGVVWVRLSGTISSAIGCNNLFAQSFLLLLASCSAGHRLIEPPSILPRCLLTWLQASWQLTNRLNEVVWLDDDKTRQLEQWLVDVHQLDEQLVRTFVSELRTAS